MNQIPLWKIKRELIRLGVYAKAIPLALIEPLRQWYCSNYNYKTSDDGIALVPIKRGSVYLFDAVKLRPAEHSTDKRAVWETLWASLVVKVP